MIAVPVRDDQVIDLRQASIPDRFHDAIGITFRIAQISGVDEDRFAGGCHEQHRVTAFDVDHVYVQRGSGLRAHGNRANQKTDDDEGPAHVAEYTPVC